MISIQRTVAYLFGIVFLMVGALGFIPTMTPGGALLGIFMLNGLHSIVHLLFGVLGIAAAITNKESLYKLYNRAGGIIYLVIGILGFIPVLVPNGLLLGLVMINTADNFLHIAIGAVLALVGFLVMEPRAGFQRA